MSQPPKHDQRSSTSALLWVAGIIVAVLLAYEVSLLSGTAALLMAFLAAVVAGLFEHSRMTLTGDQKSDTDANGGNAFTKLIGTPFDIIAAIPDPALIVDSSTTIRHANEAASQLFGKAIAGLAIEHVCRDPELLEAVAHVLRTGDVRVVRFELRLSVERFLRAHIAALPSDDGASRSAFVMLKDLSEQHRLLEMRTDFIANASHELRTPLASVRGFIETLQGPAKNDEAARARFLTIMASQAERMTRLIDDLLMLSRVEEKAYLPPTDRVAIDELIDDVIRTLRSKADEKNMTMTRETLAADVAVTGDGDELYQVFQNLVENAIKYGRDGGRVRIRCERRDERSSKATLCITIADDGPGIAPEHLPRLTERFYRVNADHSRKIGGTGLGLAIVKHVLNRHGGTLHIESELGTGTEAIVTLPIL